MNTAEIIPSLDPIAPSWLCASVLNQLTEEPPQKVQKSTTKYKSLCKRTAYRVFLTLRQCQMV
jgi:hypothetical protein